MSQVQAVKEKLPGILWCLLIAIPCHILGRLVPIVGGAEWAILAGMALVRWSAGKKALESGVKFTSKKILQYAVILLGFGMNLSVMVETGKQSLPIILCTISVSLLMAYVFRRHTSISANMAILVGVGSSICGGSAIAATAPVVEASEEEVAQSIAVIFFFNMLAALLFPPLGTLLGFSTESGEAFGMFAGTAVNDTSSVTAVAATWDSMHGLGTATLDKAVTVKLTRTLAIIPITLFLAGRRAKKEHREGAGVAVKNVFPSFILYFVLASVIKTIATHWGVSPTLFTPLKELSKFFIVMAMAAIGLQTDVIKLLKTGGRPLALGFCCWVAIILTSLGWQHLMQLW